MTTEKLRIQLRSFNVTQFENLEEAMSVLPAEILLRWINAGWLNFQTLRISDNMREVRKERGI